MDRLRRYTISGFLFVSVLGTLSHFFYEWSGKNTFVGLLTPVSESTWEHMKLIFFPGAVYLGFQNWKLKKTYPGIASASFLGLLAGTFFIPILFYTYTGILGFNLLPLDIAVFLFSASVMFYIIYRFAGSEKMMRHKTSFLLTATILAGAFLLFTYMPPGIGVFCEPFAG